MNGFAIGLWALGVVMMCSPMGQAERSGRGEGAPDWLLDPKPYRAEVALSVDGRDLTLSNGLIRRRLRLSPNAATIEYDHPGTGRTILRAVKPEARITLDDREWAIGGLVGQACQNYLSADMLVEMGSSSAAYQFTGWEERPVEKRFDWKRRIEWIALSSAWPAPGRHVVLHFAPPSAPSANLAGPVVFEDSLTAAMDESWTVHASKRHPRSTFTHEGKPGEIYALPDTCVYVERPWPMGAVSVEVTLDVGDDRRANSWGPGLALVAGSQTVSLVARPNSASFEVSGPGIDEMLHGRFDRRQPITLRARLNGQLVALEAGPAGEPLTRITAFPLRQPVESLRVGKVGKRGSGRDDRGAKGEPMRSHILGVVARGPEPAAPAVRRQDLPPVDVHYEIYDGIPVIAKWLQLTNSTDRTLRLGRFSSELLATVETAPKIDSGWSRDKLLTGLVPADQSLLEHPLLLKGQIEAPRDYVDRFQDLFVVTDYAMGGEMESMKDNPAVHWKHDPDYERTGIRYYGQYQPAMLDCSPLVGPGLDLEPGATWESFRTFEMLRDSTDRQRRGLAECRFWATFAPWTRESPIYMHITFSDHARIRDAIDQCAECEFEMMIMSFGSGYNPLRTGRDYLAGMRTLVDYAKSKGIVLGGYSLLASRGGAPEDVCIARHTGEPARRRIEGSHFGSSPCLRSRWGLDYFEQLREFHTSIGAGVFELDGSYPGDVCASTTHPGHRDFHDSQWRQWAMIRDFYRWCRGQGIYLTVPDWQFLNGTSKEPMGYVETNWSLPREHQQIITRQNIHDGTFTKGPTMGWMFVPLTQYHGGGAAATVEPLSEHLDHYETQLASLFGAGVQACYRGPRLYDTDETRAVVRKWVGFYKANRAILDSDLVHLRRADGRDWDGWLHVNAQLKTCGLAMLYNPLAEEIERTIALPLYYTGLTGKARLTVRSAFHAGAKGAAEIVTLDHRQRAHVHVIIPARSRIAVFVESGNS